MGAMTAVQLAENSDHADHHIVISCDAALPAGVQSSAHYMDEWPQTQSGPV